MKHIVFLGVISFMLLLPNSGCELSNKMYYVAPSGFDTNPGTQALPWKTLYKAAQTLQAGETAIFEDGVYNETQPTEIAFDGTSTAPIVFRAQNKHQAIIRYVGLNTVWGKLHITKQYITIQDFEVTQDVRGNSTDDVLVFCHLNSFHCTIKGNIIHNAYEECAKAYLSAFVTLSENICYDTVHEGFDVDRVNDVTINGNELYNIGRTAIMPKAGTHDAKIFDNYIRATQPLTEGIILGDQSTADSAYDPNGYEGYNLVAWNNIIVAERPGAITRGLVIYGCDTCAFFNNVVVGVQIAVTVTRSEDKKNGWSWDPLPRNPRFINNIVMNCEQSATVIDYQYIQGTFDSDYNNYYQCPHAPFESHSLYSDPEFVDLYADWHLQPQSQARNSGSIVTFTDTQGRAVYTSQDRDQKQRTEPWDIGAYEYDGVVASSYVTNLPLAMYCSP